MKDNKAIKLNISLGILSQLLSIVVNYLTKQAIFNYLGADYMGMQVIFGNIFDIITIAFGGIGTTLLVRLYAPLLKKDYNQLSALRNYFDHVSRVLVVVSALAGFFAAFAAVWLLRSSFAPKDILVYYLLNLTAILIYCRFRMDYFYLMANEKLYVSVLIYGIFDLVAMLFQIVILRFTQNFLLFLVWLCIKNLAEDGAVRLFIERSYPDTNDKKASLPGTEKKKITKDLGYLVLSKVGDLLMFSTDSMIISKIISVTVSGFYSNYYFIVSGIQNAVSMVFENIMARLGHKYAFSEPKDKAYGYFYLCCINLVITSVGVCGLYWLTDSFITLWMGEDALIGHYVVVLSSAELYLQIARRSIDAFRVNEGIFKEMTPVIIIRGVFNVILSIILGLFWGLFGIMAATVITDITTVYVYEPVLVLKRYGAKYRYELAYQAVSLLTVLISLSFTGVCAAYIPLEGWLGFIVKGCAVVAAAVLASGSIAWIMKCVIQKIQRCGRQTEA